MLRRNEREKSEERYEFRARRGRGRVAGLRALVRAASGPDSIPIGWMGRPEDLSGLVGFLASDASGYPTSQTIVIDGGYTAG
jgi:NAD(P)-dependent dehydrogenase (short-subunit alcohol dehydrogenase family)